MYLLDLFTGIGGFDFAAKRNGNIETICCSEVESYNVKFIDQNLGLDNCGDVSFCAVRAADHPDTKYADQDLVAVEETGFTTLTLEDFFEGVVPFPDIITGGFPCQDISVAGNGKGLDGERSSLVTEQLRIIEDLEPKYCIFENSPNLVNKGLDYIVSELDRMGYICEYQTVSAAGFGYPHYRKRLYLVAYMPDTAIAQQNLRVFSHVKARCSTKPKWIMPLTNRKQADTIESATVINTRSVKLRTKRINSLGNSIIPDIALAIFDAITDAESSQCVFNDEIKPYQYEQESKLSDKMPTNGIMIEGTLYVEPNNDAVNPSLTAYSNLYSTLLLKDGNNNMTSKSRATRPGGLGGLVGTLIGMGAHEGGLDPVFCERFMGFPENYTKLASFS